jgi:hypothetical protein
MKVLLDECLPLDFRHSFRDIQAHTAQWTGFKGKKNGELLEAAEAAGYDALLTVDQGIPHQQRLGDQKLAVVVLHSPTNRLQDLLPLVGRIVQVLAAIQPGQTIAVSSSD